MELEHSWSLGKASNNQSKMYVLFQGNILAQYLPIISIIRICDPNNSIYHLALWNSTLHHLYTKILRSLAWIPHIQVKHVLWNLKKAQNKLENNPFQSSLLELWGLMEPCMKQWYLKHMMMNFNLKKNICNNSRQFKRETLKAMSIKSLLQAWPNVP